jgi:hypothetical protein
MIALPGQGGFIEADDRLARSPGQGGFIEDSTLSACHHLGLSACQQPWIEIESDDRLARSRWIHRGR